MTIEVTSHVARDFLQGAAYFNTVPKVVWEYVSNSLDNPRGNQPVHCRVRIGGGLLTIEDDGRGMSRDDLQRFFTMHGENSQRAQGKTVRGRFGTGKSAAFGIADVLQVSTTRDGLRNTVELRRSEIEAATDGRPFTVKDVEVDVRTAAESGTAIQISGVKTKASDVAGTRQYIERRLGRYRQQHVILVNDEPIEFEELPFRESHVFRKDAGAFGGAQQVEMVIKVSPTPLNEESVGVDILSRGNWHELTAAGLERQEYTQYLFGEVDVPALEDDTGPIPPFDNTRSGRLNPENPVVSEIYSWIRECLEEVRRDLAERDRERRKSAEAQALKREADRIASILNRDFDNWRAELRRASAGMGGETSAQAAGVDGSSVVPGPGDHPSPVVMTGPDGGEGRRGSGPAGDGDAPRPGAGTAPGDGTGSPGGGEDGVRRRRAGEFAIEYEPASVGESRSRYDEEGRVIYINVDHPQIAAAKAEGLDKRPFRMLSYEVAAMEYALAIVRDMARTQGQIFDANDAIAEVGMVMNRIGRAIASVYDLLGT